MSSKSARSESLHSRILAAVSVCRFHGVELDIAGFTGEVAEYAPETADMLYWLKEAGLDCKAVRFNWRHLLKMKSAGPVIFLLKDGHALLLTDVDAKRNVGIFQNLVSGEKAETFEIDELRLSRLWEGDVILIKPKRSNLMRDGLFNLNYISNLILLEKKIIITIIISSITLSIITIFPPLIIMATINRVIEYKSVSSLTLLSILLFIVLLYELFLSHTRRALMTVVSARIDAKINIYLYDKLLQLPLGFFEKNPSGKILFKIGKIYQIRSFLTGKLLSTILDLITLIVIFPILFYINSNLSWIILFFALSIVLVIIAFLPAVRVAFKRTIEADVAKYGLLGETIMGIKTLKSLAIEPQRAAYWDELVAESGFAQLAFENLASWPATITLPLERLMTLGVLMLGAYWATGENSGITVGTLFGFMMLSQRVAQPLVGFARLVEDIEEVGAAIGEVSSVINHPKEVTDPTIGLRPVLTGDIAFDNVEFHYPGVRQPALRQLSFSIEAGTLLGVVGRSGSGKSTVARLLQGINTDYTGFLRLDGVDLKSINLRHLRTQLGVVLQENFLFRGTIRENIIAGRPGLTFADAVKAAKLAGADEFIERLPNGFETFIEEGSPNLSGGQRQRLAIARALIQNPKILIFDEATSALDPESEAIVNSNLMGMAQGRTTIVVSHRLMSLQSCDKIMVLDQGQLIDIGPHHELLLRCDVYRHLWQQQNRTSEQRPKEAGLSVAPYMPDII